MSAPPAAATVPGTPGTPQPPTALFTEDFSSQSATGGAIDIVGYQGSPGTAYVPGSSGASGETYFADPNWRMSARLCNGFIINGSTPLLAGDPCGSIAVGMNAMKQLASYIGQFQGMTAAARPQNQALVSYTWEPPPPGPGIQFQTNAPIPAIDGHFYRVTAVFGQANCGTGNPQERLSLIVNGALRALASNLTPCTAPGFVDYPPIQTTLPTRVAALTTPATKVNAATPGGTPTVGMQLFNGQGTGAGNDVVFDLPQIMDVTPQLDKAFSPASIASGQTSTLTFTITNTNELGGKAGIGFRDELPAGVTATGVNATTCTNGQVAAAAGSTSAVLTGASLNLGQNACTVTVQVTASTPGSYINGPDNFPAGVAGLDGLNPPAETTLTVTAPASLNLVKSTTTEAITRVGQVVTYRFLITNDGPTALSNLQVNDTQVAPATQANMSPIQCETTTLAPDASTTCVGAYTVTQTDLDAGRLTDRATASATNPGGQTVVTPESTLTLAGPQPGIEVVKSSTTTLVNAVGQQIPYTFRVTNTGNQTLLNVTVTDTQIAPAVQANLSDIVCPQTSLSPGAWEVCTATYTATLADLQNRTINDTATASGTPNGGPTVTSEPSELTIASQPLGSLGIVKSTTTAAVTAVGQVIPYTFTVTNNSTSNLTNVSVADTVEAPSLPGNLSAITCQTLTNPAGACSGMTTPLAPGQAARFTGTYTVTQADVNQGRVADSAVSNGTGPGGVPVASSPSRVVLNAPTSSLTIVKSTATTTVSAVGQQVPYTFTVANTGNQTLTNVAVTDTQVAPASQANMSTVTCQSLATPAAACAGTSATLVAGQVATFSGTYTVTAADLANGSVNDFATAAGTNPGGVRVTSPQSSATVNATTVPLTMVKTVQEDFYAEIGELVHYTFTVRNNSSTTYSNLAIQDTQSPPASQGNLSTISCVETTLDAGESTTCSATYAVTAADIDNGVLSDRATATAVDVGGTTVSTAPSSAILLAQPQPRITLRKTSTTSQITAVGEEVPYGFEVTNAGNVTVTGVSVADTQVAPASQAAMSPVVCPTGPLAAGATVKCTGTYTVSEADLDNGRLKDTAVATALAPGGDTVTSPRTELTITANPALEIQKTSSTASIDTIGQQVPYTFTVTNIAPQTVSNVRVTDTQIAPASQTAMSPIVCDETTLGPDESTECHGTYTATAADLDHGSVDDVAVASATDPSGVALPPSVPATLSIPAVQAPALTVSKTSNTSVITAVGQRVTYQFLVNNSGNTTLTVVTVVDTQTPPASPGNLTPMSCPMTKLEAGQSQICTASYTVTAADLANGSVADSAVASGIAPDGSTIASGADTLSIPAPATPPALTIVKSSNLSIISTLNEVVDYGFTVTNTGTETLTNVSVTDTQIAPAVQSNLSSVICQSRSNPAATCSGTTATLAPGQSARFAANYTVTQPDIDHGRVDDTATAAGTNSGGTRLTSAPSALSILVEPIDPEVSISKTSTTAEVTQVGQAIPYTFQVTNTGNQTLTDIAVSDTVDAPSLQSNLSDVVCPAGALEPGDSVDCTAIYTATAADLNGDSIGDAAAAHGTSPSGARVNSSLDPLEIPTVHSPALTVVKSSTTTDLTLAGQQIPYTFTVTNTGNVTLQGVSVDDVVAAPSDQANLSAVTCASLANPVAACSGTTTSLLPGQVATFAATYTTTQDDVDNGRVRDAATATGTPPATEDDPDPASVTSEAAPLAIPSDQVPHLTVVKTSTTDGVTEAGQVIPYIFRVTNDGNVTMSDVSVTDTVTAPSNQANLSAVTCESLSNPADTCSGASVTLQVGQVAIFTATYTTTQIDVDSGSLNDSATTAGTPPATEEIPDPPAFVSPASAASIAVLAEPSLSIVKDSVTTSVATAGDAILYTFTVTNDGNVTMSEVSVNDSVTAPSDPANLSAVTCQALSNPAAACSGAAVTLQVGQSATFTAAYTTTQADIDHGTVSDSATASGRQPETLGNPTPPLYTTPEPSGLDVDVDQNPHLIVAKETTTGSVTTPGQEIPYTFTVTNDGNVTMSEISVTDTVAAPSDPANLSAETCQSLSNPADTCSGPTVTLQVGQVATFVATYTTTQADIDHGAVSDSASASGRPPATPETPTPPLFTTPDPSAVDLPVEQTPHLTVLKETTTTAVTTVGQEVPYTFTVTNDGNVTMADVSVADAVAAPSDPASLSAVTCRSLENPAGNCSGTSVDLAVGQVATFGATYTTTQADLDTGGDVSDSATATGTPPATEDDPTPPPYTTPDPSVVGLEVQQQPELSIVKATTSTSVTAVGQVIPYTFTVTNEGNVTMSGVSVTDTVAAPSDPANLSAPTCASLASPAGPCSGTTVTLAAGQVATFTASYTTTAADLDAGGSVSDSATATGTPPATDENPTPPPVTTQVPSTLAVPVQQTPHLTVVKATTATAVTRLGQEIEYTFTVANDGNVTMSGVAVDDTVTAPSDPDNLTEVTCQTLASPAGPCSGTTVTLVAGQVATFTATYTATLADLQAGALADRATAAGTPPATPSSPNPPPFVTSGSSVVVVVDLPPLTGVWGANQRMTILTSDPRPLITGTGVPGDTIVLRDGDGVVLGTVVVDADGTWSWLPTSDFPVGTTEITATDSFGRTIVLTITVEPLPVVSG
ncbi:DUF7507 domain-containing protein [Microbacterium sulfonylureivorans]|uniref:DUF7507 domain-containing protein n=1 Tax=Microbacterium sulfonylureivorans TaxID=2486854 RepID=UPI0013E053E6|nr:DUF11 domain-containing protein [Microbacterium sulfonylureivorans]